MVPEIALTPQLAARFRARFGDDVAVLHSALPPADRRAAWRRLRSGEVGIALGARSAVFAPLPNVGVIVVDVEAKARTAARAGSGAARPTAQKGRLGLVPANGPSGDGTNHTCSITSV